jgi:hypothetical protein
MDKTVLQYVTDSLRLAGQLPLPGSQPSPEAIVEVTGFLNQQLDSWGTMRNSIYTIQDQTVNLTSGQYIYTIGSSASADFNIPRPVQITAADVIYETSPQIFRLPLKIIDVKQWAAERVPNLPNAIPLMLYYDAGYSQSTPTGLAQIYLWPGPMSNFQLELWYWQGLPSTLVPSDTLFMPPGYARAITFGLAAEILPLYPKRVTQQREQQIMRVAMEAKKWVEAVNAAAAVPETTIDPALVSKRASGFNWLVSTN